MAKGRASRNNVLAGLFLLGGIALAVVLVITLSNIGDLLTEQKNYTVRFELTDGAEGLDPGAPVKLGGKRVGVVVGSEFVIDASSRPKAIDVRVRVLASVPLYEDADVQIVKPLLGSTASINVSAVTGRAEEPGR